MEQNMKQDSDEPVESLIPNVSIDGEKLSLEKEPDEQPEQKDINVDEVVIKQEPQDESRDVDGSEKDDKEESDERREDVNGEEDEEEKLDKEDGDEKEEKIDDEEDEEDEEDDVRVTIEETVPDYNIRAKLKQPQQAKPTAIDLDAGQAILDVDLSTLEDKPWRKPGADISDYFNYGFDENTWKIYCDKQKKMKNIVSELTSCESFRIPIVPSNDHSKYGPMKIPTIVSNEARFPVQAWVPPTIPKVDERREHEMERERTDWPERHREREKVREKEKDRERKDREREKEQKRDKARERDRDREREKEREREKTRDREKISSRSSSTKDREKTRDREKHRETSKKRERSRDRERERDRDKKRKRSR